MTTTIDDENPEALRREIERLKARVAELERETEERVVASGDEVEAFARRVPYRALFEKSPIPMVVYRSDGVAVASNEVSLANIHAKAEAVVGKFNLLQDPQAIELGHIDPFHRAVAGEIVKMPPAMYDTGKTDIERLEDKVFWSETTYVPVKGEDGVAYVLGINEDVTERLAAEHAMQESAELLHEVTDNFPHVMYARDIRGRYILLNRRGRETVGRTWEEVKGKTVYELYSKEMADVIRESDRLVLESGETMEREETIPLESGTRHYLTTKFPLRNAEGQIYALCGVGTDITYHKQSEAENRRLQEGMLRVKEETLQALSTPLIPIADEVVAMPLIGDIDPTRARRALEALLHGVASQRAEIAILDVTGVPSVDKDVADALLSAARSVRLLGAEVVLTGIRPELAATFVDLGVELGGVITRATLKDGIAYALARTGLGRSALGGPASRARG